MIKHSTFVLLLLFFLSSCRELVQDDFPGFAPVPVVHSFLKEGMPVEVQLSWTASLDASRIKFIENAQVQLFVDDEYTETLNYRQNGCYSASVIVAPSVIYRCEITVPGHEIIIASDSIPSPIVPANVKYIPIAGRDEEGFTYPAIQFTFSNNPAEKRYFEVVIWEVIPDLEFIEDTETGEMITVYSYRDDFVQPGPVTDPVLQSEGLPINVFSNETIKEDSYTITINYTNGSYENIGGEWVNDTHPTVLELRSVSYHYYCYVKQKYLYQTGFEPEFGKSAPATSLYSNIGKGYGIFAGYSASVSDTLNMEKKH